MRLEAKPMRGTTLRKPRAGQTILLEGVDWAEYTHFLRAFAEQPRCRLTYDQGRLEIMAPMLRHDRPTRFLFLLVAALTDELDLPLLPGGSTTLRRRLKRRGLEADECFWIQHAHQMEG